ALVAQTSEEINSEDSAGTSANSSEISVRLFLRSAITRTLAPFSWAASASRTIARDDFHKAMAKKQSLGVIRLTSLTIEVTDPECKRTRYPSICATCASCMPGAA